MKNFALLAIAALSLSVISCKEEAKVEPTENVEVVVDSAVVDSTATETPEVPADSVESVVTETETATAE